MSISARMFFPAGQRAISPRIASTHCERGSRGDTPPRFAGGDGAAATAAPADWILHCVTQQQPTKRRSAKSLAHRSSELAAVLHLVRHDPPRQDLSAERAFLFEISGPIHHRRDAKTMLQHIDFASFSAAGRHVADRPASPSTYSFSRVFSNVRPIRVRSREGTKTICPPRR